LLADEEHGGTGTGMVDAAVVLEELGRAVTPSPYLSSAIGAVSLVAGVGAPDARAALLPGLAAGSTLGAVALFEPGRRYGWTSPATRATRAGEGWRVDGGKVHVADAGVATVLLVVAAVDGGDELGVFVVDAHGDGVEVTATPTVDGSRGEAAVTLSGARAWRVGGGDATPAVARTLERIGAASVVDGVGAATRALELTLEYAKQRVQFDRPIGSFQAVQHLCADMLRAVELARAAAYYACWAIDAAPAAEATRAVTIAQAYASDAFPGVGGTAIQVFGGIGFTWEHDIHLFYKRLLGAGLALGTAEDHLARLADLVVGDAPPAGPGV
jgi:alkylation response protein AidB-like acyl-CoA dehydrogenase